MNFGGRLMRDASSKQGKMPSGQGQHNQSDEDDAQHISRRDRFALLAPGT